MGSLRYLYVAILALCTLSAIFARPESGNGKGDKKGKPKPSSPDVSTPEGQISYLSRFGFLKRGRSGGKPTDADVKKALKAFQESAGIEPTGEFDLRTEGVMNSPRCGIMAVDFKTLNSGWARNALTYRIDSYPPPSELSQTVVDDTIALAFKFWSDVSQLSFSIATTGLADIKIRFATYSHGDSSPFDGPSGVLAHAYSPYTGSRLIDTIHGDAHFDDSETWTVNSYSGIDLLWVAVHEFGHSLGLDHSQVFGAVMYPYYTGYTEDFSLHSDDVAGIQYLYGDNTGSTVQPTTATPRPTTTDDDMTTTAEPVTTESPTPRPNCTTGFFAVGPMQRSNKKFVRSQRTLDGCKDYCQSLSNCWGVTYNNVTSKRRCYIHRYYTLSSSYLDFYPKIYHSDNSTSYVVVERTMHSRSRIIKGKLTREQCQSKCDNSFYCIGFSYRRNVKRRNKWTCQLTLVSKSRKTGRYSHYIRYVC